MNKLSQFFTRKEEGRMKIVVETHENGILAASLVDDKNQVVSRITSTHPPAHAGAGA